MSVTKTTSSGLALLGLTLLTVTPTLLSADVADAPAASDAPHARGEVVSCMECHEDLRAILERSVPHEPALQEDCALCHAPHAARFPKLLNHRERALCGVCHRESVLSFQQGNIHTPVKEGRCTACHEVHGSEYAGLLRMEGNDLCLSCHDYQRSQLDLPHVHPPFVDDACSDCHSPHSSEYEQQLVAPANALCSLCHPSESSELVAAHTEIPVVGTDCNSCHDPHGSIAAGLLLPIAHEPFAEGSCGDCHLLDSGTPRLVRATGKRLCVACHENDPKPGAFTHQPVAEGNCGACHTPHASRNRALLPSSIEGTCTSCHTELEERREAAKSTHPVSFDGGASCDACHQPHAADNALLLKAGPIRTCLACHETERHGHPLGEDLADPRSGMPITCITCHDPHGTPFSYQLIGERTRGLCLECHDSGDAGATAR